ncbi:MAG: hypothetical protein AAF458_19045 [Pseudomonadota bacterium]
MQVTRLNHEAIITPAMDPRIGGNINGPSLIRVPDWIANPLGRYYLYFAHHDGHFIRLAYADRVAGPWRIHAPGTLDLSQSGFAGHIASPDVIVDAERRELRMYFHGSEADTSQNVPQHTRVAVSADGLHFKTVSDNLGPPYFRVFRFDAAWHALAMPGHLFRSRDGFTDFEPVGSLATPAMRHAAVAVRGTMLHIVYTNVGDCPERLLAAELDLTRPFADGQAVEAADLLAPEHRYEGVDCPSIPSVRGIARERKFELRDPAIYVGDEGNFLLYAVAGEAGIALARIDRW